MNQQYKVGLDASTASSVMQCLKKLSENGRELYYETDFFLNKKTFIYLLLSKI